MTADRRNDVVPESLSRIVTRSLIEIEIDPDDYQLDTKLYDFRPFSDVNLEVKPPKLLPRYDKVRIVALLFAPEGAALARREIFPRLEEFHYRSGQNTDLFAAGFDDTWGQREKGKPVFNVRSFDASRRQLEDGTKWRYSGDVDVILSNMKLNRGSGEAQLDLQSCMVCQLDSMLADGAIRSVGAFFEELFRYADSQSGKDPTWGFSDRMGAKLGGSALVGLLAKLLPKGVGDKVRAAKYFAVRRIAQ